jgi:hypothetical protein
MLSDNASDRNVSVQMPSPRYYGERFYVLGTDGGSERLALVERLDIELVCSVPTGLT